MPDAHALTCPQCGAPLPALQGHSLVLCLYCDTAVRVTMEAAQAETDLQPEVVREVKRLLQTGLREQAVSRLVSAGLDHEQALEAVSGYTRQVALEIIQGQQATPLGWFFLSLFSALLLGALFSGWSGWLGWGWALVLAGMMFIALWPFRKIPGTTWRYLRAIEAQAEIQRLVEIGVVGQIHTFRALVEVHPPDAPPFLVHLNLPAHKDRLHRLHPGRTFWVKFRPGDPESVIFSRPTKSAEENM